MPTLEQLKSIFKTYGVSEKSMQVFDEVTGNGIFIRMAHKDRERTGRETHRYPHISPPKDATPAHVTDIRFVKTVNGQFDVYQRFHRHIDKKCGLSEPLHDRFQAVHRETGAICSAGVVDKSGPASRDIWTIDKLRTLNFRVGRQVTEYQRPAVMSRAVMNRYNLGMRK
jgi:hypothetical protein